MDNHTLIKKMREILSRYPKEKPVAFNYMQGRRDVLELMKMVLRKQDGIRQPNVILPAIEVVISGEVRCICCDKAIARLDEKGQVSTYPNYAVCEICENEFCGDCLDKDSEENVCMFCGNLQQ